MLQSEFQLTLEHLLVVFQVAKKEVEEEKSSVVLNFLIATCETLGTKFNNLLAFFVILHDFFSMLCHEDVCQELQANSYVILGNFVVSIFHVLS